MGGTYRLTHGREWVALRPLAGTIARVIQGTVHGPGELVTRPEDVSWEAASARNSGGDTALSPFDLQALYDVLLEPPRERATA